MTSAAVALAGVLSFAAPPAATGPDAPADGAPAHPDDRDDAAPSADSSRQPDAADASSMEASPVDPSLPAGKRAAEWFRLGDALRQDGRLSEAARAYDRSFEAKPSASASFNAALAYELAGEWLAAIDRWERHASLPELDASEREEATAKVIALSRKVSTVVVMAPPSDALRLFVDDKQVAGGRKERVMPGGVVVEAVRDDRVVRRVELTLAPGSTEVVNWLDLDPGLDARDPRGPGDGPIEGPSPAERDAARAARRVRAARRTTIGGLGVMGLGAVATATFGGLTLLERDRYRDGLSFAGCTGEPPCYPSDHEARFGAFRTTTNVAIVVTAVGAVVALAGGVAWAKLHRAHKAEPRVRLGGLALRF